MKTQTKNQKGGRLNQAQKEVLKEMHPVQRKYAIRKAGKQVVKKQVKEQTDELKKREYELLENPEENDEEIDRINEKIVDIEEKLGLYMVNDELRKAEEEMVKWSFDELENSGAFEEFDLDLDTLRESWWKYPSIKKKIVDVAFHYNPNKGGE